MTFDEAEKIKSLVDKLLTTTKRVPKRKHGDHYALVGDEWKPYSEIEAYPPEDGAWVALDILYHNEGESCANRQVCTTIWSDGQLWDDGASYEKIRKYASRYEIKSYLPLTTGPIKPKKK